jgi:hypothetical protein
MNHIIFITSEAQNLYVYGSNNYNQLGINEKFINVPKNINFKHYVIKVACGLNHTVIITNELINNVYGCCNNFNNQLVDDKIITVKNFTNLYYNQLITDIYCSDSSTIIITNKTKNNMFIRGKLNNMVFTTFTKIICSMVLMCGIYNNYLYFITNNYHNNLFILNNYKPIIINTKCQTIALKTTDKSIIFKFIDNTYKYIGICPTFYKGVNDDMEFVCNVSLSIPQTQNFINIDFSKLQYCIFSNLTTNKMLSINRNTNINNDISKIIYNLEPDGTHFNNYIAFDTETKYDENLKIYFSHNNDIYELQTFDTNNGAYYEINSNNIICINTLHFSSVIIEKNLLTNIEPINKQFFYTNHNNKLSINIFSNYTELYEIEIVNIQNNENNYYYDVNYTIQNNDIYFVSSKEQEIIVFVKIKCINRNIYYDINFVIQFINDITINDLTLNLFEKKNICLNSKYVKFNSETDILSITNNNLLITPLQLQNYFINYETPLYTKHFIIYVIHEPKIKFKKITYNKKSILIFYEIINYYNLCKKCKIHFSKNIITFNKKFIIAKLNTKKIKITCESYTYKKSLCL